MQGVSVVAPLPQHSRECSQHVRQADYRADLGSYREPQEAVILNALAGNDGLVVMATGGGKSLCYQVPPLVNGGYNCCKGLSRLAGVVADKANSN